MKHESVDRFNGWVAQRKAKKDWDEYIRRGQLNRSEISTECGFARSAFSTNDLLKSALAEAEKNLIMEGILSPAPVSNEFSDQQEKQASVGPDPRDQEIKRLRERVSLLAAENAELKAQLKSRNTILDEIIPSGRRVTLGDQL